MAKRPCHGCLRNLVMRGLCDECRKRSGAKAGAYEARRGSSSERGYGYRWQKCSAAGLRREPLCNGLRLKPDGPVVVNTHPGTVREAKVRDHIIPHRGDVVLMWADWNHQSGCKECHDVKTAKYDGGFGRGFDGGGRGSKSLETPAT